uniref:Ig-like domain-containing protein n=1 Tax=Sphenodon punctatus TaxID=8508 RepID=A0A8D0HIB9_SPHPU
MKPTSSQLLLALLQALSYSHVSEAWNSKLPGTIRALKGSCVVIQCYFTYPGPRDSLGGKFSVAWYQYRTRGYPEIYNSRSVSGVLTEYQGRTELLGDLEMGNCTLSINPVRGEDAMSYYVWINPDWVKHRFYDVTVFVEVVDTPSQLVLSDPGILTEGDNFLLTCSTQHTCPSAPPTLTWSPSGGKSVTSHERMAGGVWRVESELSYTPSHKDHGKYLQCTATFPNQQQSRGGVYLHVTYSPKDAVVSVVGDPLLKEGDSVTLRCSSQSNPPVSSYRWFHGPRKAPLRGAGTGPEVTVTDLRRDSGPYHCVAENDVGMGEDSAPVHLNVEYKPVILPQGNCTVSRTGATATCHCLVEGNPLPQLEWRLQNNTVPGDFNDTVVQAGTASWGQLVIGMLRGPAAALGNVSCAASNQHGFNQVTLPSIQAGDDQLLLMASSGAIGGLLLLALLGIVLYKVVKTRKEEAAAEEEEEDPTIYENEENKEWKKSHKGEKPSKAKKEEQINMYSKPKARKSTVAEEDLGAEDYEVMDQVEEYENLAAGGPGLFGNMSSWQQPPSLSEQIYSSV